MSVFLTSNCKFDGDSYATSLSWSNSDPIAAVSSFSVDEQDREYHQVLFINNEGVAIPNAVINHECEATAMEWQPDGRLLVVGWNDGMISSWIVDGRSKPVSTFSNASQHNAAITIIKWNPMGKRLVTGDKRGLICVWSVDARGSLSPLRQYKRKGAITSIAFCLLPLRSDTSSRKNDSKITYSPSFFFGTEQGALVYADDLGHCADVQQLPSSIDVMLFFEEKSRLVIITRSLLLTQYQVAEDGRVSRTSQVKLSITGDAVESGLKYVVWAAPGVIAMATQEKFIRLFDLTADESYNLSLSAAGDVIAKNDRVQSVSFNRNERYIAVGTKLGAVVIWKFNGALRDLNKTITAGTTSGVTSTSTDTAVISAGTSSSDWELIYRSQLPTPVPSAVLQLHWHSNQGTLGAVTEEGMVILSEMIMQCGMANDVAVVQTGSHEVNVLVVGSPETWATHTGILVKGLSVAASCFVVWSGKDARAFRVDLSAMRVEALESFSTPGMAMAIADSSQIIEDSIFIADQSIIRVANLTGTQKASITFSEAEGNVQHVDINGRILAAVTDKGIIGIYDVHAPKRPKALGSTGRFFDALTSSTLSIRSISVNCDGSRVALLCDQIGGSLKVRHPDTRLHIFDRMKGAVNTFDFSSYDRTPIKISWDNFDNRMIACEAVRNRTSSNSGNSGATAAAAGSSSNSGDPGSPSNDANAVNGAMVVDSSSDAEVEVYTLFASSEHGVLMQDSIPRRAPFGSFLGISVPRLYFRNAVNMSADQSNSDQNDGLYGSSGVVKIMSKVMRDFVGMDDVDDNARTALLDFSYNLTLGKLDEAYRAVKMIGNSALWENMAHMCVKTKRLDVAEVCLGNMGHVRGAAAVRESKKEGSLEVSIGVLAIQLGLYDDAVKLFHEAKRPDLVNELYQAAGLWEKAIKTAASLDRIHVNTTHFQYAKHLESIGDVDGAIKHYKISDTYRTEVPRMLFALNRIEELEDFVHSSDDPTLLKWWAAYLESKGKYDAARKYYNKAGDYLSQVRILCFKGDFDKAADIIQDVGDRAGAYHFARQLENQKEYQEAINFYALAGCYNHSIRLAKAYDLDSELMRFALKSTTSLILDCAQHFESKGEYDKAVQLYHKGGDYPKALDLCFKVGELDPSQSRVMFDLMNLIAQDLGSSTSPQTLARCAEFLVNYKQYDKAIDLYVLAKRLPQAIEMCMQQKIQISEDLAEKLTPAADGAAGMSAEERKDTLKELAKALKRQGSYVLASRKYTQAGDRIRAIKCLVKSGDTKAVIQFATISRNAEIYTLAANYLQQMNWRESVDIMKAIITFYTKAKAYEQLSRFYDSCAVVEIDEYRDYEKAREALKESLKYILRIESPTKQQVDMQQFIEKRIELIDKFVIGRDKIMRADSSSEGVEILQELLHEPMIEEAIRSGDCYAILVEYYYQQRQLKEAYNCLLEMESRRIPLNPYLETEVIDEIFRVNGHNSGGGSGKNRSSAQQQALSTDQGDFDQGRDSSSSYPGRGGGHDEEEEDVVEEDMEEPLEELDEDDDNRGESKSMGSNRNIRGGGGYGSQRK